MTSKMMPKKGKSLKSKPITISADLERRLNELNQNQGIAFNDPQPVANDAGNPFEANFDDMFDVALNEENHEDEEFVEDNMEIGEEASPQDVGLELGNLAEPMVEDEPVIEVGEPGENRPAVEEREEIRPATLDEMRRQWLAQHARPIRITRNDDGNALVADRINRLYGNYIPYGGTNANVTYTLTGTNPVQVTTAQVANATTIANDTETARDNG
jgi:hypothetical protein